MAVVIDHEQAFKYYCKICKKGFGCGRALGGHMRAHVFGDEPSPTEEDSMMNSSMANKCIYSLRTNLNRSRTGNSNSNSNSLLSEEEDLANCLVMLSSGCVNPLEIELSSTSECKEEEEFQMSPRINDSQSKNKRLFECKVCKKVFNSHQALGGHRASHKKVKGCFVEENVIKSTSFSSGHGVRPPWMPPSERRAKRHQCSICHRIFTSGQALGGHKRCHWVTSNQTENSIGKNELLQESNDNSNQRYKLSRTEQLDLNLSVPIDLLVEERKEKENLLSLAVSGEIVQTTWKEEEDDDDDDNQTKLTKLSELKDLNMDEDPSQWLKIGISSSSNERKGKL